MNLYTKPTLRTVKASASATISQTAAIIRTAGKDVIDLGLGEPDFDTPSHIIEAAHAAALQGQTRYPPTAGTHAIKEAIQHKFKQDNHLTFASDEIIVSNGAKQVIFNALMATLMPNDEVILVAPYFDSYRNIIALLDGKKTVIHTKAEASFCLQPQDLEAAITPKTRWLILNAPANPTGATYSLTALQALGEVLQRHPHVLVMSDEIYEHILFDGQQHYALATACPDIAERILTVNGVSKAYAMTGWRIGYGAGPRALIQSMVTVQSQISSGACAIAQAAATTALTGPQDCVQKFRQAFEERRNVVVDALNHSEYFSLVKPAGAFYALIRCDQLLEQMPSISNDQDFAHFLLQQAAVATVPGSEYEMNGYFRISTACSVDTLQQALMRIHQAVERCLAESENPPII